MKQVVIVGVDVSKSTLDIYYKPQNTFMQITNTAAGFRKWLAELQKLDTELTSVLVVLEHTGRYSHRFEQFMQSQGIGYRKVAALQIKRSLGVLRGKTDKIDAQRIADYGWLRRDDLVAEEPVAASISRLQSLLSLRRKIVADRAGYISRLKEMIATGSHTKTSCEGEIQTRIINSFTKEVSRLDEEIRLLMQSEEDLKKSTELLQSIKGVGWVVAAYMICCTNNFKKFRNARKFNCYAGLAPFNYESGSSIRGRARTSSLANKEAKTILNLAACVAVRHDLELKEYYERRVATGKRKMSCLNVVRAKLVSRMFAVIKRQGPYLQVAA